MRGDRGAKAPPLPEKLKIISPDFIYNYVCIVVILSYMDFTFTPTIGFLSFMILHQISLAPQYWVPLDMYLVHNYDNIDVLLIWC